MNFMVRSLSGYLLLFAVVFQYSSCSKLKCNSSVAGSGSYYSSSSGSYTDIDCQKSVNLNIVSSNISNFTSLSGCTAGAGYQLKEQVNINRQTNVLTYNDTVFLNNTIPGSAVVAFYVFTDSLRTYPTLLYSSQSTVSQLPTSASLPFIVIPNSGNYPLTTGNIWAGIISAPGGVSCANSFATYVTGICTVDTGTAYKVLESFPFTGVIDESGNLQLLLQSDQPYKVITGKVQNTTGNITSGLVLGANQSFITNLTGQSIVNSITTFSATIYCADVTQPWSRMKFSN